MSVEEGRVLIQIAARHYHGGGSRPDDTLVSDDGPEGPFQLAYGTYDRRITVETKLTANQAEAVLVASSGKDVVGLVILADKPFLFRMQDADLQVTTRAVVLVGDRNKPVIEAADYDVRVAGGDEPVNLRAWLYVVEP